MQRENIHVKTEAEIRVMQLQTENTKDCQQPLEARTRLDRFFLRVFRESMHQPKHLDFGLLGSRIITSCCLKPTKLMVICYDLLAAERWFRLQCFMKTPAIEETTVYHLKLNSNNTPDFSKDNNRSITNTRHPKAPWDDMNT